MTFAAASAALVVGSCGFTGGAHPANRCQRAVDLMDQRRQADFAHDYLKAYQAAKSAATQYGACAAKTTGDDRRDNWVGQGMSAAVAGQDAYLAHDPNHDSLALEFQAQNILQALLNDPNSPLHVRLSASLFLKLAQAQIAADQLEMRSFGYTRSVSRRSVASVYFMSPKNDRVTGISALLNLPSVPHDSWYDEGITLVQAHPKTGYQVFVEFGMLRGYHDDVNRYFISSRASVATTASYKELDPVGADSSAMQLSVEGASVVARAGKKVIWSEPYHAVFPPRVPLIAEIVADVSYPGDKSAATASRILIAYAKKRDLSPPPSCIYSEGGLSFMPVTGGYGVTGSDNPHASAGFNAPCK